MRQHQRERSEAEADHDRRQDEGLRNRIGVGLLERCCTYWHHRRPSAGEAARSEDEEIRPAGEQTKADNELGEATPREPGSEEYLDSEKYEQRTWDLSGGARLRGLIQRVNGARRDHPALQSNERLIFHDVDNPNLLAWSKNSEDQRDILLMVVNFDYHAVHSATIEIDLGALGLADNEPYEAVDLLDDQTYVWLGPRQWVELDPAVRSAHVLWLRRLP